ncbi:MAG: CHAT domain-containing protein [Pyrinomonadaceae bacterium]|nr:CHAT domain-containing protein [Pyrinomonadaceae bacterium]
MQAREVLESGHRFVKQDDYAKAISEFEKSRDLFAKLGDGAEAGLAENWAVQFLPDVAKFEEGRRRLAAIIESARTLKFKVLIAPAYYWLGISDYRQNNLSQSNKNLKTALRLAEASRNVIETHHAQEALARNYSRLGELETALLYASEQLPDRELYYQNINQTLRDQSTLAALSLRLKFFSTSLSFSKEALSRIREMSPASIRVNQNLRNMVNAAAAKGDFEAALNYANESKQLTVGREQSAENVQTAAEIYLLLADLKSRMKDCNAALTDYDKALELYARVPELTVGSYQIHKGRLFCFQQLNRQEDFSAELRTVLKLSEEYRATIREDSLRQTFFASEQDVFDVAIDNAISARDARGAFAFVEESRSRSLLDFVESDRPIAELEKTFGAVARPLSLAEIQARLPEKLQLIEYAVLPNRLAVWVVSKTRFDFIEKAITSDELEKKIVAYQSAVVGKAPAPEVRQQAKELYEILIPQGLDAGKQICVVANKSLHQLSFASLVSPSGKYLLEDFVLSYSPSASVLVVATENALKREQARNENLLSIGNPDFDREENPNLADLQAAESEAKTIAASYRNSLELIGTEATKEKFLLNFGNSEVIHFAGHFVANRQSPGNSKLLFAGGDLRSSELGGYKLPRAKLVVLSACETAFERYDKSEGAIGVARTFLALGAPLVVASQWKVDSEPTRDLMVAFHRNRKEKGLSTAESLRLAQLEVLSRDRTAAPFYWAAFSLIGGYSNY